MRILFCTTGTNALGETFTAASFATQLKSSGHNCYFIAPILGSKYLHTIGFQDDSILVLPSRKEGDVAFDMNQNHEAFKAFVNMANPDAVIVADWHHFQENGNAPNDAYSLYWFNKSIKIGSLDHIGFTPEGRETNLLHKDENFGLKKFISISNRYSFIIKPCPHHTNELQQEENTYYWSIFNDKINTERENLNELRQKHNTKGSIVIFQPIGFWQHRIINKACENKGIKADYYSDIMLPTIFNYLAKFDLKFTYFIVSGEKDVDEIQKIGNITLITLPPLKHELFLDYLCLSDIFITDNLMSSNLGKAVFANKASIVYKNTLDSQNGTEAIMKTNLSPKIKSKIQSFIDKDLLFPYLSFPIGLNELSKMYENNSFSETFILHELFDEKGNIELFNNLLNNDHFKQSLKNKQDTYQNKNKKLLSAEDIMSILLKETKITMA